MDNLDRYAALAQNTLAPAACAHLRRFYEAYGRGEDIGVETKKDESPASAADRETEKILRALIKENFPDHGLVGEEFGSEGIERDWVWVLDPLDGTREFLAKKDGYFGNLIALLYKGQAVFGVISEPLTGKVWSPAIPPALKGASRVSDAVLACTNPQGMFPDAAEQAGVRALQAGARGFHTHMNCIGFASVAAGGIDGAFEKELGLHDIAALLPVLSQAGAVMIDYEGRDYTGYVFDLENAATRKYGLIAARNADLAQAILTQITRAEAA